MLRIPCVRLVLVVAALLTLLVVPMAGARPLSSPAVHPSVDGGWLGATLRWVEDLAGWRRPGHSHGRSGRQTPPNSKDGTLNSTQGGGCIDPMGHPRPLCGA